MALAVLLVSCSAPVRPELPTDSPPTATVEVPADGLTLRSLGVTNGPVDAFTLPRDVVVSTRVDLPSGVTVVLSSPPAVEVGEYLRRTLPGTGFVVTADDPAGAALTFTGYGWQGSFTGTGDSSAVTLQP